MAGKAAPCPDGFELPGIGGPHRVETMDLRMAEPQPDPGKLGIEFRQPVRPRCQIDHEDISATAQHRLTQSRVGQNHATLANAGQAVPAG
nr:hypothetical protein [Gemmobacter sp.]